MDTDIADFIEQWMQLLLKEERLLHLWKNYFADKLYIWYWANIYSVLILCYFFRVFKCIGEGVSIGIICMYAVMCSFVYEYIVKNIESLD